MNPFLIPNWLYSSVTRGLKTERTSSWTLVYMWKQSPDTGVFPYHIQASKNVLSTFKRFTTVAIWCSFAFFPGELSLSFSTTFPRGLLRLEFGSFLLGFGALRRRRLCKIGVVSGISAHDFLWVCLGDEVIIWKSPISIQWKSIDWLFCFKALNLNQQTTFSQLEQNWITKEMRKSENGEYCQCRYDGLTGSKPVE